MRKYKHLTRRNDNFYLKIHSIAYIGTEYNNWQNLEKKLDTASISWEFERHLLLDVSAVTYLLFQNNS